jgi:hypothetical protein
MKSRLIPWLAAQQDLSGWLYWYTNWGFRHASTAKNNATGLAIPLQPLNFSTGRSSYDPYADAHTNEDGNLMYSSPDGPLSSQRLELLRMGFDDRALLSLLTSEERCEANHSFIHVTRKTQSILACTTTVFGYLGKLNLSLAMTELCL